MRCFLYVVLLTTACAVSAVSAARVRVTSASNEVLYDLISLDNQCNPAPVLPGVSWGFAFFKVHIAFVFTLHGSPNADCAAASPNSTLTNVQPGVPLTGRVAGTAIDLGTNTMIVTAGASALAALWMVVLAAFLLL